MTNPHPAQEKQYMAAFEDELNAFKERVRARAKKKLEESMRIIEEEEKQKRLGPGGLDPVEVFETLPQELKTCFETKDIQKLKDAIQSMDPKEAEKYMKQCVDSGLWVPEGGAKTSNDKSDYAELDDSDVKDSAPVQESNN